MILTEEFSHGVLNAIKKREEKAQKVSEGIEAFMNWAIQSHEAYPMHDNVNGLPRVSTDTKFNNCRETQDMHDTNLHHVYFETSGPSADSLNNSCLEIAIKSSGNVSVYLIGPEFGKEARSEHFNMDSMTSEEAVSKIISTIQDNDGNGFGPLLTQAAYRMSTDGINYKGAPTSVCVPQGLN